MAYQEFLRANGINPEDLSQKEYSDLLNTQDMYNDDLIHFSKSENCKDVSRSLFLCRKMVKCVIFLFYFIAVQHCITEENFYNLELVLSLM